MRAYFLCFQEQKSTELYKYSELDLSLALEVFISLLVDVHITVYDTQAMACRLFGAKQLSNPNMDHGQLDHRAHISAKQNTTIFTQEC